MAAQLIMTKMTRDEQLMYSLTKIRTRELDDKLKASCEIKNEMVKSNIKLENKINHV